MADWNSATDLQTLTGSAAFSQVQDCLKAIDGTTGTPPTTLFCGTTIRFEGSAADAFETELTVTNPTVDRTQTLQDNDGIVPLGTAGNTLFFTTSGATNVTLPTSGTLGTGNTVGAASSTDNAIAKFDGTTGKIIQNSTITLSDTSELNTSDNYLYFQVKGTLVFYMGASTLEIYSHLHPSGTGTQNLGDASGYWGDVSYKTITDRGCLGWFDNGVEMSDGKILSDIEAIKAIKKHPNKKTVYGVPMMDYKTFPKVSYKPADKDGKLLLRDENDEPYWIDKMGEKRLATDGIEMTSMFSIMLGALKELSMKNELLENRILKFEKV